MLKARYYQTDGAQGGEQNLPEWLFDGVVNENVLHQVIKAYLSNQRQGTAAAKSRGQVAGGASKPWRQKGTGRARQGTIRAVQWAGGGVAFPADSPLVEATGSQEGPGPRSPVRVQRASPG